MPGSQSRCFSFSLSSIQSMTVLSSVPSPIKKSFTPLLTPPQCLSPCGLSALNMALPDFTELASHHSDLSPDVILLVTCSSTLPIQSCSSALLLVSLPVFLTILLALILPDNSFVAPISYVSITESKLSKCRYIFCLCCRHCSVAQSCPTLCDPMDCSMPVFLVLHYFPEFAQTHVYWVNDAIQPSGPLVPFSCHQSFPASRLFPVSWLFPSGGQSIGASASA